MVRRRLLVLALAIVAAGVVLGLVFAGSRETEFEARLQGKTYQQIAAAGGGIFAYRHRRCP